MKLRRVKVLRSVVALAAPGCLYPAKPLPYDAGVAATVPAADGDVGDATVPVFNGCIQTRYVDRSAASADRTVSFGGASGRNPFAFDPPCIAVSTGQSVTFRGPFGLHQMGPGVSARSLGAGSPNNPIAVTASGEMLTVRFEQAGVFPFFCGMHHASGMAGAVWVRDP